MGQTENLELTKEEAKVLFFAVCDRIITVDKDIAILSDNDGDYYVSSREASQKELDCLNLLTTKIGRLL